MRYDMDLLRVYGLGHPNKSGMKLDWEFSEYKCRMITDTMCLETGPIPGKVLFTVVYADFI